MEMVLEALGEGVGVVSQWLGKSVGRVDNDVGRVWEGHE